MTGKHILQNLFKTILSLGIKEEHTFSQRLRFKIINTIYFTSAIVWTVYILFSLYFNNRIYSDLLGIAATATGFILIYYKKHNAAAHLIFIFHFSIWILFESMYEGRMGTPYLIISMLPLALFYFESKASNIFYVIFIFTCFILARYKSFGLLPEVITIQSNLWFFYNSNIIISFIVIIISAYLFKSNTVQYRKKLESYNYHLNQQKEEIEQQSQQISEQKAALEKSYEHITEGIEYARRIQQAILPRQSKIEEDLPHHFILFKPRDMVSGDFYWHQKIDNISMIAAVDCTGHGIPGGFMSMIGNELLNEIVIRKKHTQPDKILNELNNGIISALQNNNADLPDGMEMSLIAIDHEKETLKFSGAKNHLLIINNHETEEIKADKKAIGGILNPELPFTLHERPLKENMEVFLYTDGYSDQFGGQKGEKLKNKHFKNLLKEIYPCDCIEQKTYLENYFNDWKKGYEQLDDVLVMGIKF